VAIHPRDILLDISLKVTVDVLVGQCKCIKGFGRLDEEPIGLAWMLADRKEQRTPLSGNQLSDAA